MKTIKYIVLSAIILIALHLMNFNQTMTDYWLAPYLSAAANFDWTNMTLHVDWLSINTYSQLTIEEKFSYVFVSSENTTVYNYLSRGLLLLIVIAKKIFFWVGDLKALQLLQYIVHIWISLYMVHILKFRYQKVLFFILYAINPLILYFANYPYYYFWQVIISFIFVVYFIRNRPINNWIFLLVPIMVFFYLVRPSVLFLIVLFVLFYGYKECWKKAALALGLFIGLIFLSPSSSIGPWHTMYVGIGAYDNAYKIKLSDEEGYAYYKSITGKTVSSRNIMQSEIKDDYYVILKKRYFDILEENPLMIANHALLNIAQSYSVGYKVGNKTIIYASVLVGVVIMCLLLYTKQYILFLAIGFAGGGFSLYFPPISAYMYGSYLLIVIAMINVIKFFMKKGVSQYEK